MDSFAKAIAPVMSQNIFTYGVGATLDVPGLLVKPGLLGKRNSSSVVTEESHRARRIGNNS